MPKIRMAADLKAWVLSPDMPNRLCYQWAGRISSLQPWEQIKQLMVPHKCIIRRVISRVLRVEKGALCRAKKPAPYSGATLFVRAAQELKNLMLQQPFF